MECWQSGPVPGPRANACTCTCIYARTCTRAVLGTCTLELCFSLTLLSVQSLCGALDYRRQFIWCFCISCISLHFQKHLRRAYWGSDPTQGSTATEASKLHRHCYHSIVWPSHNLCICSLVDGHLCFPFHYGTLKDSKQILLPALVLEPGVYRAHSRHSVIICWMNESKEDSINTSV